MKNFVGIVFLAVHIIPIFNGAKFSERCTSVSDCPDNALCIIRGCEGRICLCKENFIPSSDYKSCVQLSEIGSKCSDKTRCRGIRSRCDDTNHCACQSGYNQFNGSLPFPQCKKQPLSDMASYALLGEKCGSQTFCEDPDTFCSGSKCICKNGLRKATRDEIDAYPFNLLQCVAENFKLDTPFTSDECKNFPYGHTTMPTTTAATTTVVSPTKSSVSVSMGLSPVTSTTASSELLKSSDFSLHSSPFSSSSVPLLSSSATAIFLSSASAVLAPTSTTPSAQSELSSVSSTIMPSSPGSFLPSSIPSPVQDLTTSALQTGQVSVFSSTGLPDQTALISFVSSKPKFTSSPIPNTSAKTMETVSESYVSASSSEKPPMTKSSITPSFPMGTESTGNAVMLPSSIAASFPSNGNIASSSYIFTTRTSVGNVEGTFIMSASETNSNQPSFTVTSGPEVDSSESTITPMKISDSVVMSMKTNILTPSLSVLRPSLSTALSTGMSFNSGSYQTDTKVLPSFDSSEGSRGISVSKSSTFSSNYLMSEAESELTSFSSSTMVTSFVATPSTEQTPIKPEVEVILGQNCNSDDHCPENAECLPDKCLEHRCRCKEGFVISKEEMRCFPAMELGGSCAFNDQCITRLSICTDGVCTCPSGYERNHDQTQCRRSSSWFISFPLLGEKCQDFFAECYYSTEQKCITGRCKCTEGSREMTKQDRVAKYSRHVQCVDQDNKVFNEKPECVDVQLRNTNLGTSDSEARRKINIMKGSIIGGICGFVVLIGALVALILVIRHRRRTFVRDMTRDDISESSFDRRSSGKYSFRVPRPFSMYVGQKEYESEQVSMHNSEFDPARSTRQREIIITPYVENGKDSVGSHRLQTFHPPSEENLRTTEEAMDTPLTENEISPEPLYSTIVRKNKPETQVFEDMDTLLEDNWNSPLEEPNDNYKTNTE